MRLDYQESFNMLNSILYILSVLFEGFIFIANLRCMFDIKNL